MSVLIKIGGNLYDSSLYVLPEERLFRDAWSADSEAGVISVDMPMARNIWRERIRRARAPRLAELDADFMKALETGASTATIVAEKQELRDAPAHPGIEAAATPEALKLVKPAGLDPESF
jgi:hypothetical protein